LCGFFSAFLPLNTIGVNILVLRNLSYADYPQVITQISQTLKEKTCLQIK